MFFCILKISYIKPLLSQRDYHFLYSRYIKNTHMPNLLNKMYYILFTKIERFKILDLKHSIYIFYSVSMPNLQKALLSHLHSSSYLDLINLALVAFLPPLPLPGSLALLGLSLPPGSLAPLE